MFVEPLSAFFADFAVTATWQSTSIQVIFDNAYIDSLGIAGTNPTMLAQVPEMPGVKSGQSVAIAGVNYIISTPPQPDGTGLVRCELKKA